MFKCTGISLPDDKTWVKEMSVIMDSNQPAKPDFAHDRMIGDYCIIRTLSENSRSCVHEASDPFGNLVVIKQLAREPHPVSLDNLWRELHVFKPGPDKYFPHAYALHLPSGENTQQPYLVMEYLQNHKTLEQRMSAIRECAPRMGLVQAASIGVRVLGALSKLHSRYKIAHGDIAPQNILVAENQAVLDSGAVRLIDLGMSEALDARVSNAVKGSRLGASEMHFLGTPGYASPERVGALTRPITEQSDIYSVGAVLYEIATGHKLFGVSKLDPCDPLTPVITKACAYLPEHRYGSARAMADDLSAIVNNPLASEHQKPSTKSGLHVGQFLMTGALVGVLTVMAAYNGVFPERDRRRQWWKQFEW
jgi:serine/threonine-protein kinase